MRNIVLEKSIEVALLTIEYCEKLEANRKYVIAKQLLKSGTQVLELTLMKLKMQKVKQILFIK